MEKTIEIELFIKNQTPKAIMAENLVDQDVWIPKSQIEVDGDFLSQEINYLEIPEWLAIDKELV